MKGDNTISISIPYWDGEGSFIYKTQPELDIEVELGNLGFENHELVGHEGCSKGFLWSDKKNNFFIVSYWSSESEQFTWWCNNAKQAMECWKHVVELCLAQLRLQREKEAWDKD